MPVPIKLTDNVNGASNAAWTLLPDQKTVRINVKQKAGDCMFQAFVVTPTSNPQGGQEMERIVPADVFEGGDAILHIPLPRAGVTISSRFVHTALVDEGDETRPADNAQGTATGQLRVGRVLSKGFSFDHYDFSTHATGPGGAFAWVQEAPFPGSAEGLLQLGWHYDQYSKVSFHWRIYAKGPCGISP